MKSSWQHLLFLLSAMTAGFAVIVAAVPGLGLFSDSCLSWHIEPSQDNTKMNLVARCRGGPSDVADGIVCSEIDLNLCYFEDGAWLRPNSESADAYDDTNVGKPWYPEPCYRTQLQLDPEGTSGGPVNLKVTRMTYICDPGSDGYGPMPPGVTSSMVDLADVVSNQGGILSCGRVSGQKSSSCR